MDFDFVRQSNECCIVFYVSILLHMHAFDIIRSIAIVVRILLSQRLLNLLANWSLAAKLADKAWFGV